MTLMVLHTNPGQKRPEHETHYISERITVKNLKKINDVYFEDLKASAKFGSLTKNYELFRNVSVFLLGQNRPECIMRVKIKN